MTRHVLQALAAADTTTGVRSNHVRASTNRSAFRKAAVFVNRCHHFGDASAADGGFHFSTVIFDANKAGDGETGFESYGTATADGILSLLALGRATDHPSVRAAADWLSAHHLPDQAPGFPKPTHHRWRTGLWYYYAAASSAAFRRLGISPPRSTADALAAVQRPDGAFPKPREPRQGGRSPYRDRAGPAGSCQCVVVASRSHSPGLRGAPRPHVDPVFSNKYSRACPKVFRVEKPVEAVLLRFRDKW